MSHQHHNPAAHCSCTTDHRRRGWRSRWAAIGAAVAVVAGVGGISWAGATNAQVTPSQTFITPCRIMDTRASSQVGPRGTALASGTTHTIQVTGTNGNCTIPSDASGVLVNLTVVSPGQSGFITVFPGGAARPTASSINYSVGVPALSNQVPVGIGATGQVSFYAFGGPVNLVADITGYTTAARLTSSQLAQNRWDKDLGKPATVTVGTNPNGIAFDGTSIWLTNEGSNTVTKINPTTNTVLATVAVGTGPTAAAYDGTSIWVTNRGSNTVTKVNPTTNTVLTTVTVGTNPSAAVYDGTSIWVTNYNSNTVSKINPTTNIVLATVAVGAGPTGAAYDGTSIWVTNQSSNTVTKVNATTNTATATLPTGSNPTGAAFDGANIWITNLLGSTNNVLRINPTTNSITATITAGTNAFGVAYDGRSIWVTNLSSDNLTRINPDSGTVTGTVAAGDGPQGAVFDGTSMWVTNFNSNSVSKLRTG